MPSADSPDIFIVAVAAMRPCGPGGVAQLRRADAVEMAREGVPLIVIQRQLGHTNPGNTSIYLEGIDSAEFIDTVHARRAPVVPVNSTLRP